MDLQAEKGGMLSIPGREPDEVHPVPGFGVQRVWRMPEGRSICQMVDFSTGDVSVIDTQMDFGDPPLEIG